MPGRYASALFELANESGKLESVENDLIAVQGLLDGSSDFQRLVKSPVFSAEDQTRALSAILEKLGVGDLTNNFFKLIAANRRLFAAPDMIKAFRALTADARGEVTAEVTSAKALDDEQTAALKEALKASIGKDVQLDQHVDPSLLGGLIVKIGSRMIDTSLRSKLAGLRLKLQGAG